MTVISEFLVLQMLAHLASDFYLQSQSWSDQKKAGGFRAPCLYGHVFVTFLCSSLIAFRWDWIAYASGIAVVHLFIDGVKSRMERSESLGTFRNWLFFIDQAFHLSTIVLAVYLYEKFGGDLDVTCPFLSYELLVCFLAYAVCLKPANIVIREILRVYQIVIPENEDSSLSGAGRLIGNVERLLTLTLVLIGELSAVGFIFAAKSILRFREAEGKRAEYVLVGSLLSFGIAILVGILVSTS